MTAVLLAVCEGMLVVTTAAIEAVDSPEDCSKYCTDDVVAL